jgi:hypothetical protein
MGEARPWVWRRRTFSERVFEWIFFEDVPRGCEKVIKTVHGMKCEGLNMGDEPWSEF